MFYLCGDDEKPTGQERYAPTVKGFDNINYINRISRTRSESTSSICKDANENMLFHVKCTRVQRKCFGSETWDPKLGLGQNRSHEVANRKCGNLDCDLGYDKRLCTVREELVEEREEGT